MGVFAHFETYREQESVTWAIETSNMFCSLLLDICQHHVIQAPKLTDQPPFKRGKDGAIVGVCEISQ